MSMADLFWILGLVAFFGICYFVGEGFDRLAREKPRDKREDRP